MVECRYGSDPEARIAKIRRGQVIEVLDSAYVQKTKRGVFGLDDHTAISEYRPAPGGSVAEALENTRKAVRRSKRKLGKITASMRASRRLTQEEELVVVAGSVVQGKPLGGHVHVQARQPIFASSDPRLQRWLLGMDYMLSVPLLMVQIPESARYRRVEGINTYGKIRERQYAIPPWAHRVGTGYGIEYRVPDSWMVGPQYAAFAYATSHMVTEAIVRGWTPPAFMEWTPAKVRQFEMCDKDAFSALIPKIWKEAKGMSEFGELEKWLKPVFGEAALAEEWAEGQNIFPAWEAIGGRKRRDSSGDEDEDGEESGASRRRRRSRRNRLVGNAEDRNVPGIVEGLHSSRGIYVYGVANPREVRISTNASSETVDVVQTVVAGQFPDAVVRIGDVRGARGRVAIGFGTQLRQNVTGCRRVVADLIDQVQREFEENN